MYFWSAFNTTLLAFTVTCLHFLTLFSGRNLPVQLKTPQLSVRALTFGSRVAQSSLPPGLWFVPECAFFPRF